MRSKDRWSRRLVLLLLGLSGGDAQSKLLGTHGLLDHRGSKRRQLLTRSGCSSRRCDGSRFCFVGDRRPMSELEGVCASHKHISRGF